MRSPFIACAAALLLASCVSAPAPIDAPALPTPVPAPVAPVDAVVAEAWLSTEDRSEELDSVAVWPAPAGQAWVVATAKASHTLVVFDADTGQRLRSVGGPGKGPLQFDRPNGIAIFGDLAFVVERDNHRVQVLRLPDFSHVAMVGADQLQVPYGVWVHETAPGTLEVLVTDSFMGDFRTRTLPPMQQLDQRVKRFEVSLPLDGGLSWRLAGAFGDTTEAGALRMVESIAGDPLHQRLLIADEDLRAGSTLREYSLQGRYLGRSLPVFEYDAEGIALWDCGLDGGYWIAADQLRPTVFRIFERADLEPVASFSGRRVANTDGLAVYTAGTARFPDGALFAIHDDRAVAAFDLRDVVGGLGLSPRCLQ